MDGFVSFLVFVALVGGTIWMNQNRIKRERKANPIGPYVIRASYAWDDAEPYMRNIMLKSVGVTDDAIRTELLSKEWQRLPDYAQTGLVKLQAITELNVQNLIDSKGNLK
jgi:hypothetical protein